MAVIKELSASRKKKKKNKILDDSNMEWKSSEFERKVLELASDGLSFEGTN